MQKAIWEMTLLCELHLPFFPSHQSLQFVRGNHLFRDKGKGKEDKEKVNEAVGLVENHIDFDQLISAVEIDAKEKNISV